ncbi:autotransporter outer membrane beta-barrel domain-containing protein [Pseudomonas typographi]|uniref:Autotransporter domain-containing protein n=1 Tax=Pseudomonas typographi TaxID=2715964 RepID=A0ABR7Z7X1_9PSED|nr:autotransporter outer membrane beta-barrel domain-containing protein [Pseudomonas typographi]MBD1601416.1 autotransporter domain-containing protein [Pseudomonas typographi]
MNTSNKMFAPTPLAVAMTLAFTGLPLSEARADDCPPVINANRSGGCTVPAGQNLRVSASGAINATDEAAVLIDHPVNASTTLRNSGTLASDGPGVVWLNGTEVTGNIRNNSAGLVQYTGYDKTAAALRLDDSILHGSIVNAGRIEGGGTTALGVALAGSHVTGDIRNSGTLTGRPALSLSESQVDGSVINTGTITGDTVAALLSDHSTIGGDVINRGLIQGTEFTQNVARLTYTQLDGDFINRGEIDGGTRGSGTGLVISFGQINGNFVNDNLIRDNNGLAMGTQTILGDFINRGIITGTFNPDGGGQGLSLNNAHIGADLKNTGTIEGSAGGLRLNNTVIDGRLNNSGRINGASGGQGASAEVIGVDLTGNTVVTGGLVNSGLIQGTDYALRVGDDAQLDALNIAGNDTAIFAGDVYAPRTTVSVNSNATYTLQDGNLFTVDQFINRGVLGVAATNIEGNAAQATIAGDYRQTAAGTLRTHVQDADHFGKLAVTGTATLPSQAKIDVDVSAPAQPFTTDRLAGVLSAGTLVSDGTFAVTSNSALFDFDAQKNANAVDLTLTAKAGDSLRAAVASAGLSQAEGVAQVLDGQFARGSASPLSAYFVSATSAAEVAHDLAQVLPSGDASLRASQAALGQISDALQTRLVPAGLPATDLRHSLAPSFWSQPFNTLASVPGGSSASSGQVLGFDTRTSPSQRVGMAFAYARGDSQGDAFGPAQNSRLDLWQFTGYSAHTLAPNTELLVYAGAGHNRVANQRDLALGGASGAAKARYGSLFATVGASVGHAYALTPSTRLTPSLRLDYSHIRDDGYHENGASSIAPLLLEVQARQTDQLIAGLDGRLEHAFSPNGATLRLTLGVGYDLIDQDPAVTASFAGAPGQRFNVRGSEASPWLLRGGVGLAAPLSRTATLTVNYSLQQRSDFTDQGGNVGVQWAF